jgi:2,4-didehydro-3-deoxy-L-rhamnonate hydrolase
MGGTRGCNLTAIDIPTTEGLLRRHAPFAGDPQALPVTLRLNGQTMQNESTADMIFSLARLIEFISISVQLSPGDLVLMGSPSGHGTHYDRYLRDADVLEGAISGLGALRNPCVAEPRP